MSGDVTSTEPASSQLSSLNAIIHPSLNSLMISHSFLMLLIPLVISLFYFSTVQSRRRPLFSLNLAVISLAFTNGVLIDIVEVYTILRPLHTSFWPRVFHVAIGFIGVWQSILIDLTLLIRLIAVYPPGHVGHVLFSLLIALPVLLKLTRMVNLTLFIKAVVDAMNGPNPSVMMVVVFLSKPYLKIEWVAQMVDNTYASVVFLWKMRHHGSNRITTNSSKVTSAQRMHTLFRIAVTNFVVPTIFSIVQFVCASCHVDEVILNQLMLVNIMLATFGVVFATAWAGNISRQEVHTSNPKHSSTATRLVATFRRGTDRGADRSPAATVAGSGWNSREEFKV